MDLTAELNKPSYTWHPEAQLNSENPCTCCHLYRAVALGAHDRLRDLRNLVHACECAEKAERELAVRRAAGFNALFEAAVMKEAAPAEVLRSEEKGAQKWTWGVTLSYEDLRTVTRGMDRWFQVPHSGYDMSLMEGGNLKRVRSPPLNPADIEVGDLDILFEALSADFPTIRDLRPEEIPLIFAQFPLFPAAVSESAHDNTLSDLQSRLKAKRQMQQEGDCPDSPSSGTGEPPQFLFPSMRLPPKDYVQPPTSHALAARAIRLMMPNTSPTAPLHIPFVHEWDDTDMDIVHEELDTQVTTDGDGSESAGVDRGIPMAVVIDSDDIYESDGPNIPMVVLSDSSVEDQQSVGENIPIVGIPSAVITSDSEERSAESVGEHHPARLERDPLTGKFTAASFSFVKDGWLA